jgi:hypothetical protein
MKQKDKQNKIFTDIRPVLISREVRKIIDGKKEKNKEASSSHFCVVQKKQNHPKLIFKKVINLKSTQGKKKVLAPTAGKLAKLDNGQLLKINSFDVKFETPNQFGKKVIQGEIFGQTESKSKIQPKESFKTSRALVLKFPRPFRANTQKTQIKQKVSFIKNPTFFKRSFGFFILISLFLMSSIHGLAFFQKDLITTRGKILDETTIAYQYLLSGQNSIMEKDFDLASYKFNVAADRFISAQKELNLVGDTIAYLLKVIPGGSVVSSGKNLLEAGANIAYASKCLAQALRPFSNTEDIFEEIKKKGGGETVSDKISFTFALAETFENLQLAQENLNEAQKNLEKVNPDDFPKEIQPKVSKIKIALPMLKGGLDYFISHVDVLFEILGHNEPKKYLLLFKNDRELRASGGFIGTYGLFDMKEGKIENLRVEGPYGIDGQLKEKIIAPEALRLIQPRFFMRDANWFLDFPTSAKKIILLHEKAGGPTVDGLIVFNAKVMQDLLKITGPIEISDYGVTINADNFYDETQREVELDYDKELNEPKKFVADLLPKVFERVASQDKEKWIDVINVLSKNLEGKNILIYFSDEKLEDLVKSYGFAGEVKTPSKDYLSVVASNIGGGKTDQAIEQQVNHFVEIQPDGSVIDTVKIKRKHNGDKHNFWTSVKNISFLRVYVPQGSKLIEASGFDSQFYDVVIPPIEGSVPDPLVGKIEKESYIHNPSKMRVMQEGDKTVFGNFVGIEVGQEKEIILRYQLPFKVLLSEVKPIENYHLLIQKQPGAPAYKFSSQLKYPLNFNPIWQYPKEGLSSSVPGVINFVTNLETDKIYAAMFNEEGNK